MTAADWIEVARITIEPKDYCFLITQSESGRANARLMQPFKPEEDLTIWFGSSPRSRKVREIAAKRGMLLACREDNIVGKWLDCAWFSCIIYPMVCFWELLQ